jgi:hypothetical protein
MSEIEYEELLTSFQKAETEIQKGLYEEALKYLERCDYLASKFPKSQFLYETRRLISLCKFLQGKFEEYTYERELAAEEIERLKGYDEAGEIYKDLADVLLVAGRLNLAQKYYLLAESNFCRWAKNCESDISPPEAWEAWASVCKGQAQTTKDLRILAFAEASRKFAQASSKKIEFKDFYKSRELFLRGRVSILENCFDTSSFNEEGVEKAWKLFSQAYSVDPTFRLAEICAKIFSGLNLLKESGKKAQDLFEESKVLLNSFKNIGLSRKLSSLLNSFQLVWNRQNLASFCRDIEQMLII